VSPTDSDVLRWYAQAHEGDEKKKVEKPKKRKLEIHSWLGRAKDGEWVRETVATMLKRTFEKHTKDANGKDCVLQCEELIYAHDAYRPHFEGEGKTRKSFWWRGARIWRD